MVAQRAEGLSKVIEEIDETLAELPMGRLYTFPTRQTGEAALTESVQVTLPEEEKVVDKYWMPSNPDAEPTWTLEQLEQAF